jgi:DNA-binding transcriptional LysR family regulator
VTLDLALSDRGSIWLRRLRLRANRGQRAASARLPISMRMAVRLTAITSRSPIAQRVWRLQFGEDVVEPPVRVWTDNADLLNPVLLAGHGIALQPEFLVWREVRDGLLEVGLPEWAARPLGLHLVMPPSPLRPLRVQVLIDYLARTLAHAPWVAGLQGDSA